MVHFVEIVASSSFLACKSNDTAFAAFISNKNLNSNYKLFYKCFNTLIGKLVLKAELRVRLRLNAAL